MTTPEEFTTTLLITKNRLEQFLLDLESLTPVNNKEELIKKCQSLFLPEEATFLIKYLEKTKDINQSLKNLKKSLLKIPTLKLTLAFVPNQKFVLKIASLLKSKGKNYILDIETNPNILAGAIIEVNNKILDFSLKKFLEKKNEV